MSELVLESLPIAGLKLIERNEISDNRGSFTRLFSEDELNLAGWIKPIKQINYTKTKLKGTIRGMHFQNPPYAEMKIVNCIHGKIFDVVVDLRKDSKTFLNWHGEILSSKNNKSLLIPEGFAHGFQALENNCELVYFHSEKYNKSAESGINFNDPNIKIEWPIKVSKVSERDSLHKFLDHNFLGVS